MTSNSKKRNVPFKERRFNIVYFVDSDKSRSLQLSLQSCCYLAVFILVLLTLGLSGLAWGWKQYYNLTSLANDNNQLRKTLFDYQSRYDGVYSVAYPESEGDGRVMPNKSRKPVSPALAAENLPTQKQDVKDSSQSLLPLNISSAGASSGVHKELANTSQSVRTDVVDASKSDPPSSQNLNVGPSGSLALAAKQLKPTMTDPKPTNVTAAMDDSTRLVQSRPSSTALTTSSVNEDETLNRSKALSMAHLPQKKEQDANQSRSELKNTNPSATNSPEGLSVGLQGNSRSVESVSDLAAKTGSGLAAKKVMSPVPVMNTSKNAAMSDLKVNDSTADSEMASQIGKPDVKNNGKNYSTIKSNPTQSGNEINKNSLQPLSDRGDLLSKPITSGPEIKNPMLEIDSDNLRVTFELHSRPANTLYSGNIWLAGEFDRNGTMVVLTTPSRIQVGENGVVKNPDSGEKYKVRNFIPKQLSLKINPELSHSLKKLTIGISDSDGKYRLVSVPVSSVNSEKKTSTKRG